MPPYLEVLPVERDAPRRSPHAIPIKGNLTPERIDVAREEAVNPPPPLDPPLPFRATRISAMLTGLGVAVNILDSLGGPELQVAADLATRGYGPGSSAMQIVGGGIDALREIDSLIRNEERLGFRSG